MKLDMTQLLVPDSFMVAYSSKYILKGGVIEEGLRDPKNEIINTRKRHRKKFKYL